MPESDTRQGRVASPCPERRDHALEAAGQSIEGIATPVPVIGPSVRLKADPRSGAWNQGLRRRHRGRDWAMLLGLVVMWGSAFMFTKIAVTGIPADLVAAGRLLVASLLLVPTALLFAGRPGRGGKLWLFMFLIAIFGYALPLSLITWGQGFIASGLAGILMAIMPLATLGLAHFLIPGERLTPYRVGGFVLGFLGVLVLLGPTAWPGFANGEHPLLPMLAILGGAFSYAVSSVLARLRPGGDALFTGAVTISIATLMLVPLALPGLSLETEVMPNRAEILAVLLLGIVSTALAAIVYFRLVKSAGPAFVSQLNYLIPPWAIGCGILFLGETLEPNHLYALGLILAGVLATHLERVRH